MTDLQTAETIIKEYNQCLDDIINHLCTGERTEFNRIIRDRIMITQCYADTLLGIKPDTTPDHTDITQEAELLARVEVAAQKYLS